MSAAAMLSHGSSHQDRQHMRRPLASCHKTLSDGDAARAKLLALVGLELSKGAFDDDQIAVALHQQIRAVLVRTAEAEVCGAEAKHRPSRSVRSLLSAALQSNSDLAAQSSTLRAVAAQTLAAVADRLRPRQQHRHRQPLHEAHRAVAAEVPGARAAGRALRAGAAGRADSRRHQTPGPHQRHRPPNGWRSPAPQGPPRPRLGRGSLGHRDTRG